MSFIYGAVISLNVASPFLCLHLFICFYQIHEVVGFENKAPQICLFFFKYSTNGYLLLAVILFYKAVFIFVSIIN